MLAEIDIAPAVALLSQTNSAYDVPSSPEMFSGAWVEKARALFLQLVSRGPNEDGGQLSRLHNGSAYLFLASDSGGHAIFARIRSENGTQPSAAVERSVHLTLSGEVSFEGYRIQEDVDNNQPWYVREFQAESAYACHPGTIHKTELSDDAVELVIGKHPCGEIGRPLDNQQYKALLLEARSKVAAISGYGNAEIPVGMHEDDQTR